ncbi:hypothetical protein PPERSA_04345 [Pseudocohnilembus persalinus]|uniref:Uncharacterized protein n=1 Tax=Pseudocohnilembus persalinus TaxID=266149 RepID=A0A0V0QQE7_PSEPJ|nr:hypothetical protein PPERSA_04345 [Pseudocohnilembus persalinus]|eukprot:KRX04530.1 hypothetical protein PPERSA_04345 [Pseudocohnilembus persalinus]
MSQISAKSKMKQSISDIFKESFLNFNCIEESDCNLEVNDENDDIPNIKEIATYEFAIMPEYCLSYLQNFSFNGDQERPNFLDLNDFDLDSDEENIELDETMKQDFYIRHFKTNKVNGIANQKYAGNKGLIQYGLSNGDVQNEIDLNFEDEDDDTYSLENGSEAEGEEEERGDEKSYEQEKIFTKNNSLNLQQNADNLHDYDKFEKSDYGQLHDTGENIYTQNNTDVDIINQNGKEFSEGIGDQKHQIGSIQNKDSEKKIENSDILVNLLPTSFKRTSNFEHKQKLFKNFNKNCKINKYKLDDNGDKSAQSRKQNQNVNFKIKQNQRQKQKLRVPDEQESDNVVDFLQDTPPNIKQSLLRPHFFTNQQMQQNKNKNGKNIKLCRVYQVKLQSNKSQKSQFSNPQFKNQIESFDQSEYFTNFQDQAIENNNYQQQFDTQIKNNTDGQFSVDTSNTSLSEDLAHHSEQNQISNFIGNYNTRNFIQKNFSTSDFQEFNFSPQHQVLSHRTIKINPKKGSTTTTNKSENQNTNINTNSQSNSLGNNKDIKIQNQIQQDEFENDGSIFNCDVVSVEEPKICLNNQPYFQPKLMKAIKAMWQFQMKEARTLFALYNLEKSQLYEPEIVLLELIVSGDKQKFSKCEARYSTLVKNLQDEQYSLSQNLDEIAKQTLFSEFYLIKGMLNLFQNNKFSGLMNLKSSYQHMKKIKRLLQQQIPDNETKNRIIFLEGIYNLGIALIPSVFSKLLSFIGLKHDTQKGIQLLKQCVSQFSIKSYWACTLLCIYHIQVEGNYEQAKSLLISTFNLSQKKLLNQFKQEDFQEMSDEKLLDQGQILSPICFWILSIINWKQCQPIIAIQYVNYAIESCREFKQFSYFLHFEIGWFNLTQTDWKLAKKWFELVLVYSLEMESYYKDQKIKKLFVNYGIQDAQQDAYFQNFLSQNKGYQTKLTLPHKVSVLVILAICHIAEKRENTAKAFLISALFLCQNLGSNEKSYIDQQFEKLIETFIKRKIKYLLIFEILYFLKELDKLPKENLQVWIQELEEHNLFLDKIMRNEIEQQHYGEIKEEEQDSPYFKEQQQQNQYNNENHKEIFLNKDQNYQNLNQQQQYFEDDKQNNYPNFSNQKQHQYRQNNQNEVQYPQIRLNQKLELNRNNDKIFQRNQSHQQQMQSKQNPFYQNNQTSDWKQLRNQNLISPGLSHISHRESETNRNI